MSTRVVGTVGYVPKSFTRPSDTTAYTAGDVISNSTSAPSVITFTGALKDGVGCIQQAMLLDSANQAALLDAELWLFSAAPTATNDNAAITFTDAELANLVTVIDFSVSDTKIGLATSGAGGNTVNVQGSLGIPTRNLSSNDLYGVLVARNAYTPVSAEVFTISLSMVY